MLHQRFTNCDFILSKGRSYFSTSALFCLYDIISLVYSCLFFNYLMKNNNGNTTKKYLLKQETSLCIFQIKKGLLLRITTNHFELLYLTNTSNFYMKNRMSKHVYIIQGVTHIGCSSKPWKRNPTYSNARSLIMVKFLVAFLTFL